MKSFLKKLFWKLPISQSIKTNISQKRFERILEKEKKYDAKKVITCINDSQTISDYMKYILGLYGKKSKDYKEFASHTGLNSDIHLIAYYLTQFHPNYYNDQWWGKGTTEWNNVNQAVPQFVGHYQPRKPGELGYYDLRINDVMARQIEIAKNYGMEAFCFYYYWFDGKRLLEYPLNKFLENTDLSIKFFYCWANENWTKRFSGTNDDILMGITQSENNYKAFIDSVLIDFKDVRYYRINDCPVISIYRPSLIHEPKRVLEYWRKKVKEELGTDLYLIAVQERDTAADWVSEGFDAETEFQPKQIQHSCKNITKHVRPVRKDFAGAVYDYKDLVRNKKYIIINNQKKKVFPAIMPMWDNTARRNFRGIIFHGSSPDLYKEWLIEIIKMMKKRKEFEDKIIFINAWNEWGEGTYLEPDDFYGYAYLEATYQAIMETK